LSLSYNLITGRGCQSLADLLEYRNCNLVRLDLDCNDMGDGGAFVFANALATDRKLEILNLHNSDITAGGYSSFSKVLCDTSSIESTFLSNHTLLSLGDEDMPEDVEASLELNRSSENKKQVAIKKILQCHRHFDMQPFFEWDLKVLPIAIAWFERARSVEPDDEVGIGKRKLGTIYQFICSMPEVFEPSPVPAAGDKRKRSAAISW